MERINIRKTILADEAYVLLFYYSTGGVYLRFCSSLYIKQNLDNRIIGQRKTWIIPWSS